MQLFFLPLLLFASTGVCNGFAPIHHRTFHPVTKLEAKLEDEKDSNLATLQKPVDGVNSYLSGLGKPSKSAEKTSDEASDECEIKEETETEKLLRQVKEAGTAGIISYALWEWAFWCFSVPVCVVGYRQVTGHWPDFNEQEDLKKLGAEAFAFVNFARFAVPLRIGLALGTTPWIQENVVDRFFKKDDDCDPTSEEMND